MIKIPPLQHGLLVCCYRDYEFCITRWPKRKVVADAYCDDDSIYYIRKYPNGIFKVKRSDLSIWVPYEFPYFRRWHK